MADEGQNEMLTSESTKHCGRISQFDQDSTRYLSHITANTTNNNQSIHS